MAVVSGCLYFQLIRNEGEKGNNGIYKIWQLNFRLRVLHIYLSPSDTNGNPIKWFGYKLHGADVKSGLPIAMKVTPANYSDSSVALDLVKQCFANVQTPIEYFLMDAGYDHREIYSLIRDKYHAQAIIALNKRGAKQPQAGFDWDGTPICSAGYRMVY